MFSDTRSYQELTAFGYKPQPSPGGWSADIPAHIEPLKNAGAPDAPIFLPEYWNAESAAYCATTGCAFTGTSCAGHAARRKTDVFDASLSDLCRYLTLELAQVKALTLLMPPPRRPTTKSIRSMLVRGAGQGAIFGTKKSAWGRLHNSENNEQRYVRRQAPIFFFS